MYYIISRSGSLHTLPVDAKFRSIIVIILVPSSTGSRNNRILAGAVIAGVK
jgi:hypothetical protein